MSNNHYGKCALCRQYTKLSFEHIPPEAAFNSKPAKPVRGDKLFSKGERMPWDVSGLRYENLQQGMGRYSLCEPCNNKTGSWYGNDYINIAHIIHHFFAKKPFPNPTGVEIREIYPLRFIKQVISMFCSINSNIDTVMYELRDFVLNKDKVGIDKNKYKICMYFTESNFVKYAPLSVLATFDDSGSEAIAVSEITAYPLGFILYFDPTDSRKYDGVDITSFADYGYDCSATIQLPFIVKEMNDIFPAHFRSREEIEKCVEENRKWVEDNIGE